MISYLPFKNYPEWRDPRLERDGSVTIHERNLQTLATEVYKVTGLLLQL